MVFACPWSYTRIAFNPGAASGNLRQPFRKIAVNRNAGGRGQAQATPALDNGIDITGNCRQFLMAL
jgi:hypothetical protein